MTVSTGSDQDLSHTLATRARATSDGRLVLAVVVGTCAAIVAAFAMLSVALGTWIS